MTSVTLERILVPVDCSMWCQPVLSYAITLAEQAGSSIELLGLVPKSIPGNFLWPLRSPPGLVHGTAKLLIDLVRTTIPPKLRGGSSIRLEKPAQAITTAAKELGTNLVVVRTSGNSRQKCRLVLALRLLRAQACLTLTVPEMPMKDPHQWASAGCKRILVPVDLTETSRSLVRWALAFAQRVGATTILRYAPGFLKGGRREHVARAPGWNAAPLELQLARFIAPGVMSAELDLSPEMGSPRPQLIAAMLKRADCDLLITGCPKRAWWQHIGHRHPDERLAQLAPCPVLHVPERFYATPEPGTPTPEELNTSEWRTEAKLNATLPS